MRAKRAAYEVAYICNGKNPMCQDKDIGCFYTPPVNGIKGGCMHTLDIHYAKNSILKDHPCHHPERFERYSYGDEVRYYERIGYEE